ncbi:hypothetical protein FACS189431_1700 [Alphaproteobacteria bacterium]|nr:hypothetical protein FACS189431_1700 [Alphaproteobacteria bacterium]
MKPTEQIKGKILELNKKYMTNIEDYDFWNEHIKLVVNNALKLADKFGADKEIVELGALLHDIALVSRDTNIIDHLMVKEKHHETGAEIAVKMLREINYPEEKIERVRKCVLHHRSSKNSTSIEETCVADADILAHFDNLPMLFECVFLLKKMNLVDGRESIKKSLEKDFNDLSEETNADFSDRYEMIIDVLFGGYEK